MEFREPRATINSSPEKPEHPEVQPLISTELRQEYRDRIRVLINQVIDRNIDVLVFLDRSARPFSWLFRDLWRREHQDLPIPEVKFLNIGTPNHIHEGGTRSARQAGLTFDMEKKTDVVEGGNWLTDEDISDDSILKISNDESNTLKLKKTFGQAFDGKRILVIDEILSSGRSLATAVLSIKNTFPNCEDVQGTALFLAEAGGFEDDKKRVPWLREAGMTGVFELPESGIVSGALNQDNLNKIRQKIDGKRQKSELELVSQFKKQLNMLREARAFMASQVASDARHDQLTDTFLPFEQILEKIVSGQKYTKDEYEHGRIDALKKLQGWCEELNIDSGFHRPLSVYLYSLNKTYQDRNFFVQELTDIESKDFSDLGHLIDRYQTLRREMREIAEGA